MEQSNTTAVLLAASTIMSLIVRDEGTSGDVRHSSTTVFYYGKTAMISSIGALVIELLTVISAGYLIFPLCRQGASKLRTKYLLGMVISDVALGIVGFIPTANYLAGHPLKAGTASCNAAGFILTAVLFTQHLWTFIIAVTTYALLKFPMSRFTRGLHVYWYIPPLLVWTIAILHSAGWYVAFGFAPSAGGALCYYGPGKNNYDRSVIQFIPRALVFIVVIILYSRLFQFLRRPDTISVSESARDTAELATRGFLQNQEAKQKQNRPAATGFWGKIGESVGLQQSGRGMQELKEPVPPWELLHINTAGLNLETMEVPATAPSLGEEKPPQRVPLSWKIPSDDNARSDRIPTASTLVGSEQGSAIHDHDTRKPTSIAEEAGEVIALPTLARNPDSSSRHSLDRYPEGPPSPLQLNDEMAASNNAGPRYVAASKEESERSDHEDNGSKGDQQAEEPIEHTLRNFFQANQASDNDASQTAGSDIRAEESAAAYFNRQASLLMLYFPLAYMFIFAFSMVRLLYDMITSKPNAGLTIASLWFVLSAGLVDALVYGVAEIVVRRRVRRNLPGHLSQLRGSQSGDV